MTNYTCTSIKKIEDTKLDCDARLIRAIWKSTDEDELLKVYPQAEDILNASRGYYRRVSLLELKMECVNNAGGFHGVEYLGRHKRTGQGVEYCNAGDTYAGTIIFIGRRLIVSTVGDMVERNTVKTDPQY